MPRASHFELWQAVRKGQEQDARRDVAERTMGYPWKPGQQRPVLKVSRAGYAGNGTLVPYERRWRHCNIESICRIKSWYLITDSK
jgi:hypothetical protein